MVRATSEAPSKTIEIPIAHGCRPTHRPYTMPAVNKIAMAMALETRRAGTALCMKINGITTGIVARNTSTNTPSAPSQSSLHKCARSGGSGSCFNRWCIASSSAGSRIVATIDGNASAMSRCACCGSAALRTAGKS